MLYDRLKFRPGDLYSQQQQERPRPASPVSAFSVIRNAIYPKDTARRCDTLNLQINTVYDLPLDGELELNVTTKSNDQTGPGAIFSVTKRNIFGGGETFGVSMRGSYEWQTGKRVSGNSSAINSWEFGISGTLTFPRYFPQLDKA